MANSLSLHGFSVTVVAMYSGDVLESENQGNIKVRRLRLKSNQLPDGFKPFGAIKYLEYFFKVVKNYKNADIWHCNDFVPFLVGILARYFNSKLKIVYDCHELQSETRGIGRFEKKFIKFIERKYINSVKVITVGESIKSVYESRYGLNGEDVEIIYNAPHLVCLLYTSDAADE